MPTTNQNTNVDPAVAIAAETGPTNEDYVERLLDEASKRTGITDREHLRTSMTAANPDYFTDPVRSLQNLNKVPDKPLTLSQEKQQELADIVNRNKGDLSAATGQRVEDLNPVSQKKKTELDPSSPLDVSGMDLHTFMAHFQGSGIVPDEHIKSFYFQLQSDEAKRKAFEASEGVRAYADRTPSTVAGDVALSVSKFPLLVGETAYGVANVVTGGSLDNALKIGGGFQEARDIINQWQSFQTTKQREFTNEEIERLAKEERYFRESNTDFWSTLNSFVREYGKGALTFTDNPAVLWDSVIESGLAFTMPAAVSNIVRTQALKGLSKKQRDAFLADTAKMSVLDRNEKLAALISISAMEAGGNALAVQDMIRNTPFEQLEANNDLYNRLLLEYTPEEAREKLAANVGVGVYAINFLVSGIISKATGTDKIAAELSRKIGDVGSRVLRPVSTGIRETIEETGQSGLGAFASNLGQLAVDRDTVLSEGVAAQAGQGAVSGGLSGFGTQAIAEVAKTFVESSNALVQKGARIAQDATIAKEVEQADVSGDFSSLAPTEAMDSTDILVRIKRLATHMVKEDVITDEAKIDSIEAVFDQLQEAYEIKFTGELKAQIFEDAQTNPEKYPEITEALNQLKDSSLTDEVRGQAADVVDNYALQQAKAQAERILYEDDSSEFALATTRVAEVYKERVKRNVSKVQSGETLSSKELQDTVRTFGSNPDSYELSDINSFVSSEQFKQLPAQSQNVVRAAKAFKESLVTAEEVSGVIKDGGTLDGQEWRGVRTYVNNFNNRLQRKDRKGAVEVAEDLQRWFKTRKQKMDEWLAKPSTGPRAAVIAQMEKENHAMRTALNLMATHLGVKVNTIKTGTDDAATQAPATTTETVESGETTTPTESPETTEPVAETEQPSNITEQVQPATVDVEGQAVEAVQTNEDTTETVLNNTEDLVDDGLGITEDTPANQSVLTRLADSFKKFSLPEAFKSLSYQDFYRFVKPKSPVGVDVSLLNDANKLMELAGRDDLNPIGLTKIKSFVDSIVSGFDNVDMNRQGKDTSVFIQLNGNPSLSLVDENGNLPKEIQELLSLALVKVLANDYNLHSVINDDNTIKSFLGIDKHTKVPPETLRRFRKVGSPAERLYSDLSREIEGLLGIKPLNTLNNETYNAAITSLASTTVSAALSSGLLENSLVSMSSDFNNKSFIKLARNDNGLFTQDSEAIKQLKEESSWFDTIFNETNTANKPVVDKPAKVRSTFVSRNPLVALQKLPKGVQEILLKHSQRPNIVNPDFESHFSMMPLDFQQLVAGVIPQEFFQDLHITERESIEAANEAITRELESSNQWIQESNGEDFFFEHVMYSNGRIGIKSTAVNPQASKFQRHLFGLKSAAVQINPETDTQAMLEFKMAVGAAFGLKVDQANINEVNDKFSELMNDPQLQQIMEVMETADWNESNYTLLYDVLSNAEHPSMGFHAITAIKAYLDADGGKFATTLSLEIDGKTNGFAFSALQFSSDTDSDTLIEAMKRAAIYTDEGVTYGSWYNKGQNQDTYESLAGIVQSLVEGIADEGDHQAKALATLVGFKIIEPLEEGGKKTKAYTISRNLAKQPVMVTMYGAGISGVIDNFVQDIMTNMYKEISKPEADAKKYAIVNALNLLMPEEANKIDWRVPNTDFVFSEEGTQVLRNMLISQYSDVVEEGLNQLFGDIAESRNKVVEASNQAYDVFYKVWSKKYQAKVMELNETLYEQLKNTVSAEQLEDAFNYYKKSTLNKKEVNDLIKTMSGEFPVVASYFLDSNESGIVVPKSSNNNSPVKVFFKQVGLKVLKKHKNGETERVYYEVDDQGNLTWNGFGKFIVEYDQGTIVSERWFKEGQTKVTTDILKEVFGNSLPKISSKTGTKFKEPINIDRVGTKNTTRKTQKTLGTPSTINTFDFENPGVSMAPKGVQSLDGSVQLNVMKDMDMLNVHDASYYALGEAIKGGALSNKAFHTVNSEYSIFDATATMLEQTIAVAEANGVDASQLNSQLALIKKSGERAYKIKGDFLSKAIVHQYTSSVGDGEYNHPKTQTQLKTEVEAILADGAGPMGSSSQGTPNFTADDTFTINPENTVAIYNGLAAMGNADPVNVNPLHQEKLNLLLTGMIAPLVKPLKLLVQKTAPETLGMYERKGGDRVIKMQLGSQAPTVLAQSRQEVYVHELVHAVMETPMEVPTAYRKRLTQLYNIAQKHLTPADLLPPTTTGIPHTQTDLDKAQQVFDYIFRNTGQSRVDAGLANTMVDRNTNNALHEFVAFGLTNENVMNALNNLFKNPEAAKEFRQGEKYSPLKTEANSGIFNSVMNMVNELFNYLAFKVKGYLDRINGLDGKDADEVLFELVTRMAGVERKQGVTYEKLEAQGNAAVQRVAKKVILPIAQVMEKTNFKLAQGIGGTIRLFPRLDSSKIGNMFNRVVNNYSESKDSLVAGIGRELIGRTKDNRTFSNLLMMSREFIDKVRTETIIAASNVVRKAMHRDMTKEEAGAFQRAAMHTDLQALFEGDVNDLIDLVSDDSKRNQKIIELENAITKLSPKYGNYIKNHALNLGYFMVNKKSYYKGDALFNATQIANLRTLGLNPDYTVDANIIKQIDQLASLRALEFSNRADLAIAAKFMREEVSAKRDNKSNGIQFFMDSMKNHKEQSKQNLFQGSEELMTKGFVKENFNPNTGFEVVNEVEAMNLRKQGVEIFGPITKDEHDNNKERVYLVKSGALALNTRTRGAISVTNKKKAGTDLLEARNQGFEVGDTTNALFAAQDFALIKKQRKGFNQAFLSGRPLKQAQESNPVFPVYDNQGNITGYRYMMSEANRIAIAERHDSFSDTFGAMMGSIADKANTTKINKMIIDELYADYRKNFKKNPKMYTKVGPTVADKENAEMWALMPKETRDYVKTVFGESNLWVAKENYRRIFGFQRGSLADVGNWLDQKFQDTYLETFARGLASVLKHNTTANIETMWKDVVTFAKDRIVIVSGSVLMMNIISNLFVLAVEGVNPIKMAKYHKEGWEQLKSFQRDNMEVLKLKNKLADTTLSASGKKLIQAKIAQLEDQLTNNPVRPLIDRGVFQSIIEDVEMLDDPFSSKSKLEEKLQPITDKIPAVVKDIGSALYMTSNTSTYGFLRDATQMSDFIARYTLHKHNMEKGMDFEDSIDLIMDDFINYEEPTHKTIQWLNDMGLLMFTKFYIRIQKVILRQMRDKPLNVLTLWGIEDFIDKDLSTIDDTLVSPRNTMNRAYSPITNLQTAITPALPEFSL